MGQPALVGREREYVLECLDSGWISSGGRFVAEFEASMKSFLHAEHVFACTNGTSALHLALAATGIGPAAEVIVPNLTYAASAHAVVYCGAAPVFVDSEEGTWNMDPAAVERAVTERTRAVVVVHLYGQPARMAEITEIARRHRLAVVEDAAEAIGAEFEGRRVGVLGDVGAFSLFGNKIITSGEGGVVVTRDGALADRIRLLRNQGNDPNRRYWHLTVGYNYRMTNVTAAIALAQMEKVDWHLERRRDIRSWYDKHLPAGLGITLQKSAPGTRHAHWMVAAELPVPSQADRDRVMSEMLEMDIETRPVFYLVSDMPPYRTAAAAPCPVAARVSARGIVLPTHAALTEADVERIAAALSMAVGKVSQSL